MANTTISPNMNLPVPVVGTDPGPDWATNINASLNAIDSHNHTTGQGVPITPPGIDINVDLPFNSNNGTTLRTTRYVSQSAALTLPTDIGCLYVVNNELYYNDETGTAVPITHNGSVNAGAGSITGLPSGTASASYSSGTFTFQSATNTPATMAVGPLVIGNQVANSKTITLSPPNALAANYSLAMPAALPGSTSIINCDSSGNEGFVAPDNSSFGIQSGNYAVLDGGISTAKIANAAVTTDKLSAPNFRGAFVTSYNLTSATYIEIGGSGGLDFSFTSTSGRPIIILSGPDGSNISSLNFSGATTTLTLAIFQDSSPIAQISYIPQSAVQIPLTWSYILSTPGTSSHTYSLRGFITNGSVTFTHVSFYIQEL